MGMAKRYIIAIGDDNREPLDGLCAKLIEADLPLRCDANTFGDWSARHPCAHFGKAPPARGGGLLDEKLTWSAIRSIPATYQQYSRS
jgi:hypothetical protein